MTSPARPASLPPPVQNPEFEGPLDLLLDEVRRQNVVIENLAMAPIVARFLEYVGSAAGRNLNLDIEWIHMAATLIHWKSRSLLPPGPTEDPRKDTIRDDLVQQLLAHRKQAADELARRRALEEAQFTRGAAPEGAHPTTTDPEEPDEEVFTSVWDLIQQARDLAHWTGQHREDRRRWRESFSVEPDDVTVSEMMDYLRGEVTAGNATLDGITLLESQATPSRRSSLFLGMLEMARDHEIDIRQEEIFGVVWISVAKTA